MEAVSSIDKVSAALVAAQAEFRVVIEGGYNSYDKYKYARLEDYVEAIRPILSKHGLAVAFTSVNLSPEPKHVTEKGKEEYNFVVTVEAMLIHASGQFMRFQGYGQGIDRSDKSIYKAMTGARKYVLANIFNLATGDDPENETANPEDRAKRPPAPPQQQQRPPQQQQPAAPPQQNRAEQGMNNAAQQQQKPPAPVAGKSARHEEILKLSDEQLGATLETVAGSYAARYADKGATAAKVIFKNSTTLNGGKELVGADNAGYFFQFANNPETAERHGKRMAFLRVLISHLASLCERDGIAWEIPVPQDLAF